MPVSQSRAWSTITSAAGNRRNWSSDSAGAGCHSLAVLKVEFVVERAHRPQRVRNFCQTLVPSAHRPGIPAIRYFGRGRGVGIQKISEHAEPGMVPEARRQIRIGRKKGRRRAPRIVQHSGDRRFSRSQANYVSPQAKWITGSHHGRKREIGRSAGHDRVRKFQTPASEGVEERRGGARVAKKPGMIGPEAIHRDQDQRSRGLHANLPPARRISTCRCLA